MSSRRLVVARLGRTDYAFAWEVQRAAFRRRLAGTLPDMLLLTEHRHVYTLGTSGDSRHLLASEEELAAAGIHVHTVDRGGDVTYHGPGQLVGYPILSLHENGFDAHRYLRTLEEVIIGSLSGFGYAARREEEYTGVWVGGDKIAAIGIKVSRGITMHGFAFNINTDLSFFERIIPCGIFHRGVTSLERLSGTAYTMSAVEDVVIRQFSRLFGVSVEEQGAGEFIRSLHSQEAIECLQ